MELSKEQIEKAVKAYMDVTGFSDLSSDDMSRRTSGVVAVLNLAQAHHEAELQAQRAVLTGPVTDDEWATFPHRGIQTFRAFADWLLAARAAKLDKKPELDPLSDLLTPLDQTGRHADPWARPPVDVTNERIRTAYERGRKAVQP